MNDFFPLSSYVKEGEVPASVVESSFCLPQTRPPKGDGFPKKKGKTFDALVAQTDRRKGSDWRPIPVLSLPDALLEKRGVRRSLPPQQRSKTRPEVRPVQRSSHMQAVQSKRQSQQTALTCPCGMYAAKRSTLCSGCLIRRRRVAFKSLRLP